MARNISLYFAPSNTTALLATTVAGGVATTSITLSAPYPYVFPNLSRTITFTSTDNLSATNFTITGTDGFGNSISEIIAGPNNATVTSVNQYNTVTNIVASAAWTNFSIGYGSTGTFQWIKTNTQISPPSFTISGQVLGTINYSVNQTLDSIGQGVTIGQTTLSYVQPKANALVSTALATDGATAVVTVTCPLNNSLVTGNSVTIAGVNATVGGITAANLNVTSLITVVSGTSFTYTAAAASNTAVGSPGGGPAVKYYFPALPVPFAVTAALTGATANQLYSFSSTATAFQCVVNSSTGGSLTLNILQAGIE